jgi:hypothetical protein
MENWCSEKRLNKNSQPGTQDAHERTCSKEVAGLEAIGIPRRLQDMVVTSYMQVRTRLTVAHSPVVPPVRASFKNPCPCVYVHH